MSATWDAIVLAGGGSTRLGGVDKAGLHLDGLTLLQVTARAVSQSQRVVVVGDEQLAEQVTAEAGERGVVVRENPPHGGPAAGIAAGVSEVSAPVTLVLACDMPQVARVVPVLLEALAAAAPSVHGVIACDGERVQYLAAAHRTAALRGRVETGGPWTGRSVRQLYDGLRTQVVDVPAGSTQDIDSWDDARRAGVDR